MPRALGRLPGLWLPRSCSTRCYLILPVPVCQCRELFTLPGSQGDRKLLLLEQCHPLYLLLSPRHSLLLLTLQLKGQVLSLLEPPTGDTEYRSQGGGFRDTKEWFKNVQMPKWQMLRPLV